MSHTALFEGLIIDEYNNPVEVTFVGSESCYVVDDAGFRRHIPAEQVDRQVLQMMKEMITGHEDLLSEQAAKMLGQDDPFSVASIAQQLKHLDKQFDIILQQGLPEAQRAYMGMMGFQVRINIHGEVIGLEQPGMVDPDDE
ncbi:MAG: hypothetical protein GY792_07705 [Gammaproteobacteria bacterium]|nr:hypothetical protein [Gammaproteobacteria bacterium]